MSDTMKRPSFEERLLPMLREAVIEASLHDGPDGRNARPRRSTKRRRIVLLAATVAFVVSASLIGGVALGRRNVVKVDGLQAVNDPQEVERQLRDTGIDATVVVVPLPTVEGQDWSWQGSWWWITVDQPEQLSQDEFDHLYAQVGMGGVDSSIPIETTHILELPKMSGHVTLYVGRQVPDQRFNVFAYDRINELSPLGTFSCLAVDPNDPAALGAAIEQRGYRIVWTLEAGNQGSAVSSPPAGTVATWAWLRGPGVVDMRLAPAGPWAAKYQAAEGTFPSGTTPPWAPPCS
jgi:hypothetical protein